MKQITLESSASFSRVLRTNTGIFILDIYWCTTGAYWYMNVYDASRTVLLMSGIKLLLGFDIFSGFINSKTPIGECILSTTTASTLPPRFDNISEYVLIFKEL